MPVPIQHPIGFFDSSAEHQHTAVAFIETALTDPTAMIAAVTLAEEAPDTANIRSFAELKAPEVKPSVATALGVLADILDTRMDRDLTFDPDTEAALLRSTNQRARIRTMAENGADPRDVLMVRLGRLGFYPRRVEQYEREQRRLKNL
jgi:hypothetical protein